MTDRCLLPGTTAPSWRHPCDLQASAGAGEGISGALCSPLCLQLPGGCVLPTPCWCHGAELPGWGCHQFFREGKESWGGGGLGAGVTLLQLRAWGIPLGTLCDAPLRCLGGTWRRNPLPSAAQPKHPAQPARLRCPWVWPPPHPQPLTPPQVVFSPHRGSAPQLPRSYLGLPRWERAVSHPAAPAGREVAGVWEGHPGWWWGLSWGGYF